MTRANDVNQRVILLATDSSQSIIGENVEGKVNTIGYSAYGEQSAQQEVASALGFNGQLREAKLGWYLLGNGYRAYNTRLMRFHSPDSWSPFGGGGLNAYMYCVGDPVNRVDPTGHNPWLAFALAVDDAKALFRLPNSRSGATLPKIDTTVAANAARALQASRTFEKTRDLSGLTAAAEYIGGTKPKIYWRNNGGEIHGVAAARPGPSTLGAAYVTSRSRTPSRARPGAPHQNGGLTTGSQTYFGPPPSYQQATFSKNPDKWWNADTIANGIPPSKFTVFLEASPRVDYWAKPPKYPLLTPPVNPFDDPELDNLRGALAAAQARVRGG